MAFPRKMSSSSSSKGTRKTYSFEEREILITLINKYEDVEDKKSDPTSMCKRKSAWAQLAEEYNSMVGPHGSRSAVQLRRCWENMKACKRNREEKRTGVGAKIISTPSHERLRTGTGNWEGTSGHNSLETAATGNIGLPPNVVFEPKTSEPFTLQSVSVSKAPKLNLKRDFESRVGPGTCKQITVLSDLCGSKVEMPPLVGPMGDCPEKSMTDQESSTEDNQSEREEPIERKFRNFKTNATQTLHSPLVLQNRVQRRTNKALQREEELHVLALSEAQMKVDIAAMLKEEARVKLEEAHYRKEEARLRMLFFTYKLDRLKDADQ